MRVSNAYKGAKCDKQEAAGWNSNSMYNVQTADSDFFLPSNASVTFWIQPAQPWEQW